MNWHISRKVTSTVGADPNAWFEKTFEERLTKDEAFKAKVLAALHSSASGTPAGRPAINLPPSLNKVAGSHGATGSDPDDGDASDAATFRYAAPQRRR
jgi:hypothetical protein